MFLHRIHLDPRCREARRDLADPYQLHSTICRAFSRPDRKCPDAEFMWRLEPENDPTGQPRILVQSRTMPEWSGIGVQRWLAKADAAINLADRLKLDTLKTGQRFRFRLRANPCVTRNGKRQGLLKEMDQVLWLVRKGQQHGFSLPKLATFDLSETSPGQADVRVSQPQLLRGKQHTGNGISVFSVLYDGMLMVTEADKFRAALQKGIGHGKAMGLGLLSVVPIS